MSSVQFLCICTCTYMYMYMCVYYTHTTAEPWMEASYSVYALFPHASIDHSRPQAININVFKLQYNFYNNESLVFKFMEVSENSSSHEDWLTKQHIHVRTYKYMYVICTRHMLHAHSLGSSSQALSGTHMPPSSTNDLTRSLSVTKIMNVHACTVGVKKSVRTS